MSETLEIDPHDAFLARQVMPQQDIQIIQKRSFFYVEMMTPVGRLLICNVIEPSVFTGNNDRGAADEKKPMPKYMVRMLFGAGTKERPIINDIHKAAAMLVDHKFPHGIEVPDVTTGQVSIVPAHDMFFVDEKRGGFHYPLRDGNDLFMQNAVDNKIYRNKWFINASMHAKTWAPEGQVGQDQRPILMDREGNILHDKEQMSKLFYAGAFARAAIWLKVFQFEMNGRVMRTGVNIELKALRYAAKGEHLGNIYSEAKAQALFGTLEPDSGDPEGIEGAGFHTASTAPSSVSGTVAAFPRPGAPAPQQPVSQPLQPNHPAGYTPAEYIPATRPAGPGGGRARPPGV
jgi:Protein of unknown function (DUF2815)